MRPRRRLSSVWNSLFRKDRAERDLTEELRCYRDLLIEKKVSEGCTPEAARRAALIENGRHRADQRACEGGQNDISSGEPWPGPVLWSAQAA